MYEFINVISMRVSNKFQLACIKKVDMCDHVFRVLSSISILFIKVIVIVSDMYVITCFDN